MTDNLTLPTTLTELGQLADELLARGEQQYEDLLETTVQLGRVYLAARTEALKTRSWEAWLRDRQTSSQAALKLIHIAEAFRNIPGPGAPLKMARSTLALIAGPKVPTATRAELIQMATEKHLPYDKAQEIILAAKRELDPLPPNYPQIAQVDLQGLYFGLEMALRGKTERILGELVNRLGSSVLERQDPVLQTVIEALDDIIQRAQEWKQKLLVAPPVTLRRLK